MVDQQKQENGVITTDVNDSSKRYIKIEDLLKKESNNEDEIEKYEFLKARYLLRFPFSLTAVKWGVGLGSVFALHTYIRTRSITNTAYWFFCGSVLTGFPIFGFFMFKHTFYQMAIKKFEREQTTLIDESNFKREYVRRKLHVKDENITDEDLVEKLAQKQKIIFEANSPLCLIFFFFFFSNNILLIKLWSYFIEIADK